MKSEVCLTVSDVGVDLSPIVEGLDTPPPVYCGPFSSHTLVNSRLSLMTV